MCSKHETFTNWKSINHFPMPLKNEVYSICCRVDQNCNVMLWSSKSTPPPVCGLVRTVGVENGRATHRNVEPRFSFDFYTHHRPLLHCLATIHNAAHRQTDRAASNRNKRQQLSPTLIIICRTYSFTSLN